MLEKENDDLFYKFPFVAVGDGGLAVVEDTHYSFFTDVGDGLVTEEQVSGSISFPLMAHGTSFRLSQIPNSIHRLFSDQLLFLAQTVSTPRDRFSMTS